MAQDLKRMLGKAARQPAYAARVAVKRLAAVAQYHLGRGRAPLPESITLFLTYRCNLRCKMCGQWGEAGVTKKDAPEAVGREMPFGDLIAFVDTVARFGPNITLFGGEPLLYAGCVELIEHIKQKGMHCLVITNGFLLEGAAERLVASGLDELNVSLDGGRELHDGIRGMPGLFDRIMRGLGKVQEIKKRSGVRAPLVNLQCTVTRYNVDRLEEMIGVADAAGADSLTFHNLIFLEREVLDRQKMYDVELGCASGGWEGFVFEPGIDCDVLWNKIQEIRARRYRFTVDFYPHLTRSELKDYYGSAGPAPRGSSGKCLSPWIAAYVFPDGEVRPCLNSTYAYGNIRTEPFPAVWNSDKAVRFRAALKKSGFFPACVRCTERYRY